MYDLLSIVPFLKKYHVDPANGEPLAIKDLVRLNFFKCGCRCVCVPPL